MTYQEYKSPYSITEHVRYNRGPDTNTYTGIIVAVRFTFASVSFDIVEDKSSTLHEKILLDYIEASLQPNYYIDCRLPNVVELENNLFTEKVGYNEIIFGKPKSILAPPHVSSVEEIINAPSRNTMLSEDTMQPERVKQQLKKGEQDAA